MSEYKIEIKNLYKIFGTNPQAQVEKVKAGVSKQQLLEEHNHVLGLKDVNINVQERKLQVIMGLSGSGKSTLIRHINRLIEPTQGELLIEGQDVLKFNDAQLKHFRRFGASMVFQKFALLPHRTVLENALYGLRIQGKDDDQAIANAQKWLSRVGLEGFENRYPAQLSGGMQQRVGLARALATDAEILLMDEAFSALDPLIRMDMQDVLLGLQDELHKTIVFITHDLDEALRIGDDIAILRDGEVVQSGTAQEIVLRPADDYVSDFIQDINRGRVIEVGALVENGKEAQGPQISSDTKLEEALLFLSSNNAQSGNVVKDGKSIGAVHLNTIIQAMARPDGGNISQDRYR